MGNLLQWVVQLVPKLSDGSPLADLKLYRQALNWRFMLSKKYDLSTLIKLVHDGNGNSCYLSKWFGERDKKYFV